MAFILCLVFWRCTEQFTNIASSVELYLLVYFCGVSIFWHRSLSVSNFCHLGGNATPVRYGREPLVFYGDYHPTTNGREILNQSELMDEYS